MDTSHSYGRCSFAGSRFTIATFLIANTKSQLAILEFDVMN